MGIELEGEGIDDPMGEEFTNPAGSITRRYPDRLIINVTNECAMYCRHCQRRRNIGLDDNHTSRDHLSESIEYVRNNPEIRDVLVTGGDAFALSDDTLDWLLGELHVSNAFSGWDWACSTAWRTMTRCFIAIAIRANSSSARNSLSAAA